MLNRRHAILRSAKLSQDFGEVTYVTEAFGKAMSRHFDNYRAAEIKPGGIDEQTATFFTKQKDQIAEDARANLESYLTADGMNRLHAFIMSEKANMTAIAGPAMPMTGATK